MTEQMRIASLAGINIALAVLAMVALIVVDWIVTSAGGWYYHGGLAGFFVLGILYGHVLFIAAVGSMGPWRWQIRVPVMAAVWLVLVSVEMVTYAMTLGIVELDEPITLILVATTAIPLAMLHLPLGPRFRRWRLTLCGNDSHEKRMTFSIRDLLVWTAIIALFLAGGRVLIALYPTERTLPDGLHVVFHFLQFAAAALLISWPLFWALWSDGLWWKLPFSFMTAAAATALECYWMIWTYMQPVPSDTWMLIGLICAMNLTMYLVLAIHCVTVRAFGYRLA